MALLAGWLPDRLFATIFLGAWLCVVLVHGLSRSFGEAKQDPIRLRPTD